MAMPLFIFLVEEQSMEEFLRAWLPRFLPATCMYRIHSHRGKDDLFDKLEARLRSYSAWREEGRRIFVLVDRDNDDCRELKQKIEKTAAAVKMKTRRAVGRSEWDLVSRIAIEELEAWYFGDWEAVRRAFPRVPSRIPASAPYRDPDGITGGTWEAFERVMMRAGYFKTGLRKTEAAKAIGKNIELGRSRSKSFRLLASALQEALGEAAS